MVGIKGKDSMDAKKITDPQFIVNNCDCGNPNCKSLMFIMVDPVIRETLGDGWTKLCPMVNFPVDLAQSFVDELRRLCRQKGVHIK